MNYRFETNAIRTQSERSNFLEHSSPLYITSSFIFEDAEEMRASFAEEKERNIYSRFSNPNTSGFIEKICQMEGAEDGVTFSSGMGAVFGTFASLLNAGDHIISSRSVFGSTHSLFTKYFPKWHINTSYFNIDQIDQIEKLIQKKTKCIYVESPTNPGVEILDLEFLSKIAEKYNLLFIVDNCFATPYLQNPIQYGADLVIHSATKLIDGQGRVLGGIVVGKKEFIREIYLFSRNTGNTLSPFNAWVLSKSLETLAVRIERHCSSALEISKKLEKVDQISWVKYPFLTSHPQYELAKKQMKFGGNIISFELKGGLSAGYDFINKIKLCSLSSNLGDTRTIITHPASTTHSKLSIEDRFKVGISEGMIRLSIGLEHPKDIWADLKQAINI